MKIFKRKSFYAAVVAALGAMGAMDTASAVNVNSNGLGQVLIYPYYSVRGGMDTYVSVVNTTASAKAVKVRFTEGKNSREVLDFNLYLSPRDMWTGAVVATASGAKLVTRDKSCTAPPIPSAGQDFVNFAYVGTVVPGIVDTGGDGGGDSLDRTREGYFEIIEMGVITNAAIAAAVTHSSGTPANCGLVSGGLDMGAGAGANAVVPPQGGLGGGASLINVAAGVDFGYDPVALDSFSSLNLWAAPGSIAPDLTFADPFSVVFNNGAAVLSNWGTRGDQAVSAVLMHDQLINEFVLDSEVLAGTDWVVTMPTKRYNVPVAGDATTAIAPFTTEFSAGGACEPVSLAYWDREEGAITTGVIFSPPPAVIGNSLCWESTVVTFNNSNVLGSANSVNVPVTFQNGWLEMGFQGNGHTLVSAELHTYSGLPTIGFMVQDLINQNAAPGVLATYGGNFTHKYRTLISNIAP